MTSAKWTNKPMLLLYTSNHNGMLISDLAAGVDPLSAVGANTLFLSSSWTSPDHLAYLDRLNIYGRPVVLALGGPTSDAHIERLLGAVADRGLNLAMLMLRDEPWLRGGNTSEGKAILADLAREIATIRRHSPAVRIGLNTTAHRDNWCALDLALDCNLIDNYLNEGTTLANMRDFAQAWIEQADRRCPGRPLGHIGMLHDYAHPAAAVTLTDALMMQMFHAIFDVWKDRLAVWGLYGWIPDWGYQRHSRSQHRLRAIGRAFAAQWYQAPTSSAFLVPTPVDPEIPGARLSVGDLSLVVGQKAAVSIRDSQAFLAEVDGDLTIHERIPPGLTSWTVNAIGAGTTTVVYRLSTGQVLEQRLVVTEPAKQVIFAVPKGTTEIVLRLER